MATVFARTQPQPSDTRVSPHDYAKREVSVTFVDVMPDDYDPDVAAAFGSLAAQYEETATALFDDDPDLTSHIASKRPGAV